MCGVWGLEALPLPIPMKASGGRRALQRTVASCKMCSKGGGRKLRNQNGVRMKGIGPHLLGIFSPVGTLAFCAAEVFSCPNSHQGPREASCFLPCPVEAPLGNEGKGALCAAWGGADSSIEGIGLHSVLLGGNSAALDDGDAGCGR